MKSQFGWIHSVVIPLTTTRLILIGQEMLINISHIIVRGKAVFIYLFVLLFGESSKQ